MVAFMVNCYVKGRRFEHQVKKSYEAKGYTVIRSAGSKGKIDLIAWKKETMCKLPYPIHPLISNENIPNELISIEQLDVVKVIQCKVYAAKTKHPLRTDLELLKQVDVPAGWQRVLAWKCNGESKFKEEVV